MSSSPWDRVWFYYSKEKQVGPVSEMDLREAISGGVLTINDFVYREGYADWKLLKEVPELLAPAEAPSGKPSQLPRLGPPPAPEGEKRLAAKRAPMAELVVAHNDKHVATGSIRNISTSGIFFETEDGVFGLNDEVKVTLKEGRGLGRPLHLKCVVVRRAADARYPVGYGLELKSVDDNLKARIEDYVR